MNELVTWGSDSDSRVPSVTGSSVLTSLKGDHIWEFLSRFFSISKIFYFPLKTKTCIYFKQ